MAWYPIGPSSYPDLFGQMQYTNSKRIADQFLSMARDFAAVFGANGDRLTPNEAKRSRDRQMYLWDNRNALGVVVARPFTSRHDEVFHGNAIDVGVTMANGQNRALTPAEFAWMHTQAELRGFTWTGVNFGEPWHIEGATRPEHFPPYPDIIAGAPAVPDAAPAPAPEPAPAPTPPPIPKKEVDVLYVRSDKAQKQYYVIGETTVLPVSDVRARTYSQAVAGDTGLFQTLSSGAVSMLIDDARKRRKQANLPVLDAIEDALKTEDKPEA